MRNVVLKPPFFEIGPKNYLFGDQILDLARIADEAAAKYDVRVIYTTPYADIRRVAENVKHLKVFAPHVDDIPVGRGLACVLGESLKAAGAVGVMLNHAERPLPASTLVRTLNRARELGLMSIVCADSMADASKIATLAPDIIVAEPSELIGTGVSVGPEYVEAAMQSVKAVNPNILVLTAAGISNGTDVYNTIIAGADATGSSSGVAKAADRPAMVDEMIAAVRKAWDERHN